MIFQLIFIQCCGSATPKRCAVCYFLKRTLGDAVKNVAIGFAAVLALAGTPVFAADMAVKAPPPAPPSAPVYSWTGCYVGGNVGLGWSRQSQNRIDQFGVGPAPASYGVETDTSLVGGAQVGCDYQFASA